MYHNPGIMIHQDSLCNTGVTQEAVVYHFFDFVLHKKAICRLNQQVDMMTPGHVHSSSFRSLALTAFRFASHHRAAFVFGVPGG